MEISVPIEIKCPHCQKVAVRVEIPLPIEKAIEIFKSIKK